MAVVPSKELVRREGISRGLKRAYALGLRKLSPLNTSWSDPELRGKHISETRKRRIASGEIVIDVKQQFRKGIHSTPETEFKKGHGLIGGGFLGGSHSEEFKKRQGILQRIRCENPNYIKRLSFSQKVLWEDSEHAKKFFIGGIRVGQKF